MGYRGTRAQLEARLPSLSAELGTLHEELAEASRKVDALREVQWGSLGVMWFRFTLRRALRDVDASPRHNGTVKGLAKAVERHERALAQGRDVLRWLAESLAPEEAEEPPARTTLPGPTPSPVAGPLRGALAVVGAVARNVWAFAIPLLLLLGLVLAIVAAVGGDDDLDVDLDFDTDDVGGGPVVVAPEERHAADVGIGAAVVVLTSLLAAAGAGLWWWLR